MVPLNNDTMGDGTCTKGSYLGLDRDPTGMVRLRVAPLPVSPPLLSLSLPSPILSSDTFSGPSPHRRLLPSDYKGRLETGDRPGVGERRTGDVDDPVTRTVPRALPTPVTLFRRNP